MPEAETPSEAKPDWRIIAGFGKKMGFKGYDWQDSNQVFEEAARFSRSGMLNYHPLVVKAFLITPDEKEFPSQKKDLVGANPTR